MKYILFLNKCWGVDFMLKRKLDNENIEYDYVSLFEEGKIDRDMYLKYGIKSTPTLITLDKDREADRLTSIEEIVNFLKKNV